jgi:undecaprenyl phosphate N,N'-diacetylbacillosamine 1-phosphate transferase
MYKKYFKRIFDLILCIIALPIFIVMLVVVGTIIYLEDKGPILYIAQRLGKDGKIFKMYKFRSMKLNAPDIRNEDGSTFNSEDDPRLTRVGKFIRKTSIDEIPQLLNVIKGEMSVIGPRPDLPEHVLLYEGNESRKLEIRPGVTGYNQAYYRNTIPWKQRIEYDIYYIDNMSAWIDIKVFFKTIASVLEGRNIFMKSGSNSQNDEDDNG